MTNTNRKPTLDEIKTWPLDKVQAQFDAEQAEIRAVDDPMIDGPLTGSRDNYHSSLTCHYRIGYMRWLLAGAPQPMPRFV